MPKTKTTKRSAKTGTKTASKRTATASKRSKPTAAQDRPAHKAFSYAGRVDAIVNTVSIICSVAGGHLTGLHRNSTAKVHRDMQWERHYKRLLNMGLHISPAANQDTHRTNFGTVSAARTGS